MGDKDFTSKLIQLLELVSQEEKKYRKCSLVPRLSPCVNEKSKLQATESWAGPGNEATENVSEKQLVELKPQFFGPQSNA